MLVMYDFRADTERFAHRGCWFRPPVRHEGKRGIAFYLIVGILLAAYVVAPPLLLTRSQAADVPSKKQASDPKLARFVLIRRSVAQDQGAWVIDYQLRHTGLTGVILSRSEVSAVVEGWVSNSRVASHAVPRMSRVTVSGTSAGSATGDVIVSSDESQRCRERSRHLGVE